MRPGIGGSGDEAADSELLGRLLRGSRRPATELAQCLLQRFGGLRQLTLADDRALLAEPGIGAANLAVIRSLPAMARRYFAESLPVGQPIRSPADTADFLHARTRHLGHELFCCVYLDNRHRVLRFDELFRGTIDGTSVYPREIVKEALAVNAAAIIVAHNCY